MTSKGNALKDDLHKRLKDLHGGMTSMEGLKVNGWKDDLHIILKDLQGGMTSREG